MRPAVSPTTFSRPPGAPRLPVTQLRVGRVVGLGLLAAALLLGGTVWLLTSKARPLTTPVTESTGWPAWMRQALPYPAPDAPVPVADKTVAVDPHAALLAKLAALQAEMERQRLELEALKKRPSGQTVIHQA